MDLIAIFGPTGVGKTAVAIELATLLREQGEDPVAVSCDAIQVYRGLEYLSGAPDAVERKRLEHRLTGIVDVGEEFSAGRFADLARAEIDSLLASGRTPIVVGGTGLYMRAALTDLELRPPVPPLVRRRIEADMAARGPLALHSDLDPDVAERIHPNDRKRIARALELQAVGLDPPERGRELWTARLRHPTKLVGIAVDREELVSRIDARVDAMVDAGAPGEVRAADEAGASRTARSALGFEALLGGDVERMKAEHRRYASRQMTWMRRMDGLTTVDRTGLDDAETARRLLAVISRRIRSIPRSAGSPGSP